MSKQFRVRELAQDRGLTQEELTARARQHAGVDISLSTVRRIWQNKKAGSPRGDTLIAIADVLGVSVKDLYADEEDGQSAPNRAILAGTNKMSLVAQQ